MKVKLEGFRELERKLMDLPKATARNVLRRTARDALEPMANAAANLAPEDEGRLAFSISIGENRTRRVRKLARSQGVQMAMGPGSGLATLEYASFVEFGTVDTPAQPYMRPAWDSKKLETLEIIKRDLAKNIDAAAGRAARKRARAG